MTRWHRAGVLGLLAVAAVLAVLMYWSQHLTHKAGDAAEPGDRVAVLKKAARVWPFNDRAFFELGKAYFDDGYRNLDDAAAGKELLQKSAQSFIRSLRLNPGDFYGHYDYAQALFYLDHLSPEEDIDFIQEYKKAADLTGHRNEIFFEVGKVLLSQWEDLSEEDRNFAAGLLKKTAGSANREQFESILHTWELNVGDYAVMGRILPDNPGLLRMYARFLGEKSLDQRERQNVLALAEHLEFQNAREEFSRAENHFRYYRPKQAAQYYNRCLGLLKNLKFYQSLTGRARIDTSEFIDIWTTAHLKLAKCGIQQGQTLDEVEEYLRTYLAMTDRVADASELDTYLVEKRLIGAKLEDSANDLGLLSFHSYLYFKQNHHRDIKNIGALLERSFVVVPEADKQDYIDVLRWVAAAHQITGYFYDATDFYRKALDLDESNVKTLLGLRRNFERLNDEREIRRIDQRLDRLLSPREIDFRDQAIGKGQAFERAMLLDGNTVSLSLEFDGTEEEGRVSPLVSVEWNGRVVWEDYLREDTVILLIESKEGENRLRITPLNRTLMLKRIVRR